MSNISSRINKYQIFQGPAVVYIGATGVTPTEIGGVFNVSIEIGMETERFVQGWPKQLQELFIKAKTVKVKFDSAESGDYSLLRYALGSCGLTQNSASVAMNQLSIGDQNTMNKCSLKLIIINAEGVTEDLRIWSAVGGQDGVTINMADDGLHTPSYTFEALRQTQDWAGISLVNGIIAWDEVSLAQGLRYKNAQLCFLMVQGTGLTVT